MVVVTRTAQYIGEVNWPGVSKRTGLWLGYHRSTGAPRVYVSFDGGPVTRETGKNLVYLADRLDAVLRAGEASWNGEVNAAALAELNSFRSR